jgi:uracil-DNA glycosylase family 4
MSNFVPGSGPVSPDLMVVGEGPGDMENLRGEVLVGPTGEEVERLFSEHRRHLREFWKTNVLKWQPPGNSVKRFPETGHTIEECEKMLWEEIDQIKPKCILALGDLALSTLTGNTGILNWRGSILTTKRGYPKVIPTIHPAALFKQKGDEDKGGLPYFWKRIISLDFKRAIYQSQFPEYIVPKRTLQIIKNPTDLLLFLNQNRDKKRCSVDLEVIQSIPTCVGLAFSKDHAISVPLFNFWEDNRKILDHTLQQMWDVLANFFSRQDIEWIGQNIKFDLEKIITILGFRAKIDIYCDTSLMGHTLHPELPKSLQLLTSIYTDEPYYKDELKEYDSKKDNPEQILTYNARDAAVTYELSGTLEEELRQRNLWYFYLRIPNRAHAFYFHLDRIGLRTNEEKRQELIRKYAAWRARNEARLTELCGRPINVASPKDVPWLVFEHLRLPLRNSCDEDTLVALMGNHAKTDKQKECLHLVLETRKVRKTNSTYLNAPPDFDGRMRTIYNIGGTESARTSNQKLKNPIRPFKKPGIGWAFQTLTKHGEIGPDVREICVPDPGYVFLQADLSQAEAREVAHLSSDQETLKLFETTDIHKVTAGWSFNKKPEDITPDERFIGKTARYSGLYGAKKRRLMNTINTDAYKFSIRDSNGKIVSISEFRAGKILETFHARTPNVQGVYHPAIQEALANNNRILVNAYGRERQFFDRWGDDLFREAYAYIPSSSVHDHILLAAFRIVERAPWIIFLIDAHDAWLTQVPEDRTDEASKIVREEMEVPFDFSRCSIPCGKLVIPCDIEIGMDYKNLKKQKRVA